ncbi:MAG: sulfurtransferase-like selenium metabolism protein YedF [Candidatus Zixiibacteriota bacterium]|nr:MAG: sulfurtransferase-like selenium metabolism protein YedF [candidate division Zixibacteria bacterium]
MAKTLVVNNEYMGHGSEELGRQLIGSFFRKLWGLDTKPGRIIFYNSAVKLLAKGSPVLEALDGLQEAGVDLIACGTCVTYFDLKDKIVVGRVSSMNEISSALSNDSETITI